MKKSCRCESLLTDIRRDAATGNPLRTLNVLGSGPLMYRTFGGNPQSHARLDPDVMETAFHPHYLLTLLAQCALIRTCLYTETDSCHTLYGDPNVVSFLERHGILKAGFWSHVDDTALSGITAQNTDMRIYYSYGKPDGIAREAARAREAGNIPIAFIDADLILKKRFDVFVKDLDCIDAAYGHQEKIGTSCYPDFRTLHFPKGYHLADDLPMDLPAVNTCLMFFHNLELAEQWCAFFRELFMNNFIDGPLDDAVISRQLLGFDQRTFPMIAHRLGLWETGQVKPILDLIWDPPHFIRSDGMPAQWHFYTLENHPEHPDWMQEITHIWIAKKDIEKDKRFQNYQCCLMIEMILELMPQAEEAIRSFAGIRPYFDLLEEYGGLDHMLEIGIVSDHLVKSREKE